MARRPVLFPSNRIISNLRLAGLGAVVLWPLLATGQVVEYDATALGSGVWQDASRWNISPTGSGAGFPNNQPDENYHVTIPGNYTYDNFTADVTVSSFTTTAGMTIRNGAGIILTIDGPFNSSGVGATVATANPTQWVFNGDSTCNAAFDFRNGSSFINHGTMTFGSASAAVQTADAVTLPASGYSMANTGTLILDRPGGVTFQNFRGLNSGLIEVRQGTVQAEQFTQASGTFRIRTGSTLRANSLNFQGGEVFAAGSTLNGSSFTFQNTILHIGETGSEVAHLTIQGNASGNAGQGATFNFLIASGTSHDTMTLENGMNFDGLTLTPFVLNGYTIRPSDVFTLITGNNLGNGRFHNQIGDSPNAKLDVAGLGVFDLARNNNSVVLSNFTPIPEPGHFALAVGVALTGFGLWRRLGA